jgi:peptidoglycan/LPS O-acetylase OafA/YrhL
MNAKKEKIKCLESYRGLACLTIVIFHYPTSSFLHLNSFVQSANYLLFFFFVLSGFVISHNYFDKLYNFQLLKEFGIKRFLRLWPLHITIILLYLFFEAAKYFILNTSYINVNLSVPPFAGGKSVRNLIETIFLIQALFEQKYSTWNTPAWSISTEFYTYLLFGLALFVSRKKSSLVLILTFVFFSLIQNSYLIDISFINEYKRFFNTSPESIICWHHSCRWLNLMNNNSLTGTIFTGYASISGLFFLTIGSFIFGVIVNLIYKKFYHTKVNEIFCWFFLILAIYLLVVEKNFIIFDTVWLLIIIFGFLIFTSAFLNSSSYLSKILNLGILQFLGKISYSLYMIHFLLGYLLNQFLRLVIKVDVTMTEQNTAAHFNFTPLESLGYTFIYLTLSILASWFLYVFIENRFRAK